MGVKFIKSENKNTGPSFDAKLQRLADINGGRLVNNVVLEASNKDHWEAMKKRRDVFTDTKGHNMRPIASIPKAIYLQACKIFGDDFIKDDKKFKKFLESEIFNGIKGESCLTVPRERL